MEVMAAHNTTHESLNPSTHQDNHHHHQQQEQQEEETIANGIDKIDFSTGGGREQLNGGPKRMETSSSESNTSIGVQTALSYTKQGTMVPLTALLQLVNNSILTVMENIEKVLAVNPGDQNVIDSIDTFWNVAVAANSIANSPADDRMSPVSTSEKRGIEKVPEDETSNKAIVIQDRFQNSLEIPNLGGGNGDTVKIDVETQPPPLKRQCIDASGETITQGNSPRGGQSPSTPVNPMDQPQTSLSPTVNVAGSLTKYICPYCYKVFNWKTNMNRHISMTHLMKPKPAIKVPIMRKSKPYTCPLCGNTFAWRSNMNRHILHLHKIDHKQLNKYLLSAYLPEVQRDGGEGEQVAPGNADPSSSFSSLSSLTMLPQQKGSFKPNTVNSPPKTMAPGVASAIDPPYSNFLYRKNVIDGVKKEQVPLHIKEAALSSFYQSNKSLFDTTTSTAFTTQTSSSPKPSLSSTSPSTQAAISSLSALYQKALLEEQQRAAAAAAAANPSTTTTSTNDVSSILYNQNHRAMLDTVSLLSNLGGVNLTNLANGLSNSTSEPDIKVEAGMDK